MDNTEKKAKIRSCRFVSEWTGQNGIVYYHEVELDNGDKGQIGTKDKNPDKLNIGQELTYTIEATSRGNKIKAVSSSSGFKPGGRQQQEPKVQFIGFAMRYTVDLIIANKAGVNELQKVFGDVYGQMISKL